MVSGAGAGAVAGTTTRSTFNNNNWDSNTPVTSRSRDAGGSIYTSRGSYQSSLDTGRLTTRSSHTQSHQSQSLSQHQQRDQRGGATATTATGTGRRTDEGSHRAAGRRVWVRVAEQLVKAGKKDMYRLIRSLNSNQ
jgi:hypothetical protein